jgi:hypothetical protein
MIRLKRRAPWALGMWFVFIALTTATAAADDDAQDVLDPPEAQEPEAPRAEPRPPQNQRQQVGWIRPNHSRPKIDAPFALVDNSGLIRCYVRPAPGVDLSAYVNQKVGVRGSEITVPNLSTRVLEVSEVGQPGAPPQQQRTEGARRRPAPRDESQRPVRKAQYTQRSPTPAAENIPTPAARPGQGNLQPTDQPLDGAADFATQAPEGQDYSAALDWSPARTDCGGNGCGSPCCSRCCGPPGRFWVRAEYLYWSTQGMRVPPLVTTGPSAAQPGFIGSTGTQVLSGNSLVDGYGRSGGRITAGTWINPCQTVGVEADYFQLITATSNFSATSTGDPILSRPFFDVAPTKAEQNVQLVASPGVVSGTVSDSTYTQLLGAGARLRLNLCCGSNCFSNQCLPNMNGPGGYRYDFLLGYRYLRLADGVSVNENLTAGASAPVTQQGTFLINDTFRTVNQFNGLDFGTLFMFYRGRWGLEFIERVALGFTNQRVDITGQTISTPTGGTSTTSQGGLLAQTSNIGSYSRDAFSFVPELNANLTYAFTPRLRAVVGYTVIFWSNVARAGSQIDTDVNSTLLPQSTQPATGDLRHPQFSYHEAPFWAQGISAGLDYRW